MCACEHVSMCACEQGHCLLGKEQVPSDTQPTAAGILCHTTPSWIRHWPLPPRGYPQLQIFVWLSMWIRLNLRWPLPFSRTLAKSTPHNKDLWLNQETEHPNHSMFSVGNPGNQAFNLMHLQTFCWAYTSQQGDFLPRTHYINSMLPVIIPIPPSNP